MREIKRMEQMKEGGWVDRWREEKVIAKTAEIKHKCPNKGSFVPTSSSLTS